MKQAGVMHNHFLYDVAFKQSKDLWFNIVHYSSFFHQSTIAKTPMLVIIKNGDQDLIIMLLMSVS